MANIHSLNAARDGIFTIIGGFHDADAWPLVEESWPQMAAWYDARPWTHEILPTALGERWVDIDPAALLPALQMKRKGIAPRAKQSDLSVLMLESRLDDVVDVVQFTRDYAQMVTNLAVTYQWCSVFRALLVQWCRTYKIDIPKPRLSDDQRRHLAGAMGFDVTDPQVSDAVLGVGYEQEELALFQPDPAISLNDRIAVLEDLMAAHIPTTQVGLIVTAEVTDES